MKKMRIPVTSIIMVVALILLPGGCARTWQFTPIDEFKPSGTVPPAATCEGCHPDQFASWKKTRHSSETHMQIVPVPELRQCGACHSDLAAHAADASVKPALSPSKLSKTDQNTLCGKCHYNQAIMGGGAINPNDKHALFMSVGLENRKRQLSCLDCHSGHKGKSDMLVSIRAHICFKCHKEAIVTMGIFQPINYIAAGYACQGCHTVHGGSTGAKAARMGVGVCIVCHFAGTAIAGD